ncbi:MAG: hypothetical protein HOP91_02625 [Sphingomonas sp.]|nr:hypothetical protein [Sphingomonas sp.]
MNIAPLIAGFIALFAIWRAHVAGAAYVVAGETGKSNRGAIAQSVISIAIALFAVWMAR